MQFKVYTSFKADALERNSELESVQLLHPDVVPTYERRRLTALSIFSPALTAVINQRDTAITSEQKQRFIYRPPNTGTNPATPKQL